jgi:hypothetical protein
VRWCESDSSRKVSAPSADEGICSRCPAACLRPHWIMRRDRGRRADDVLSVAETIASLYGDGPSAHQYCRSISRSVERPQARRMHVTLLSCHDRQTLARVRAQQMLATRILSTSIRVNRISTTFGLESPPASHQIDAVASPRFDTDVVRPARLREMLSDGWRRGGRP